MRACSAVVVLSVCVYTKSNVLQGSVATRLKCWDSLLSLYYKFLFESVSRIFDKDMDKSMVTCSSSHIVV